MIYRTTSVLELKLKPEKKIYCFGAGKAFDSFMNEFFKFELEKNIKGIADNKFDLISVSTKTINNVHIPIISLEHMLREIEANDCILITTAAYEEIIEQLEKIEKLNNIEYFIYSIVRTEQYDYERLQIHIPSQLSIYNEIKIPKTIHYCWFGGKKIPDSYKKWMESWKYYCPDYEIIEWNENNYDVYKNQYMSQAYERNEWAFVSDYARIDIINEYGGVYLDTDVELVKNIDLLLMNNAFCGFESNQYVAYGLGFGASRHNPILQEIKAYYDNNTFLLKDGTLNRTSCPIIQTEVMKRHGLRCTGEFQVVEGMTVYPSRILCGMSPHSFRIERNLLYTFAIHHFEGSWVNKNDKSWKNKQILNMKKWGSNDNYIYADL